MKSGADLDRLREISSQQAVLIYRLTELKREENEILARYPVEPIPTEKVERKKSLSKLRAAQTKKRTTEYWRRKKERERAKARKGIAPSSERSKYFQTGRGE